MLNVSGEFLLADIVNLAIVSLNALFLARVIKQFGQKRCNKYLYGQSKGDE